MSDLDSRGEKVSIFSKDFDTLMSVAREEVDWFFGDWEPGEGIGTSDISCCVRAIYDKMNVDPDSASREEYQLIRNLVSNNLSELEENRLTF
jgi:hypothetical protein